MSHSYLSIDIFLVSSGLLTDRLLKYIESVKSSAVVRQSGWLVMTDICAILLYCVLILSTSRFVLELHFF